jgi:hypothetical protein
MEVKKRSIYRGGTFDEKMKSVEIPGVKREHCFRACGRARTRGAE